MRNVRPTWWSLDDAIFWIASPSRHQLLETSYWEFEQAEFDDYSFFSALAQLVDGLDSGEVAAQGSIDTRPVAPIEAPFWNSVNFIPSWGDLKWKKWNRIWPQLLILSQTPFRAEALLDHSERSHILVPDAANPQDVPGYYRVTKEVMFHRDDILKFWPAESFTDPHAAAPAKRRKKRDLTLKVEQSLPMMKHDGLSLAEEKRGLSNMKIAQKLADRWLDEGDTSVHELDAIAKSVERYYKRNALPSDIRAAQTLARA